MNETMKKMNDEARASLVASITSKAVEALIASTKQASDDDCGSFNVVISTADTDRQGDSVDQAGWDLTYYKQNPVVLWGHDYGSLPIGMCTSIDVKEGKLTAVGKFAPTDANPFAQQVRRLYDLGMVRATSVGFIPKESDYSRDPVKILKAELLEFSFVPVPANPHALTLDQVKTLKLDTAFLKTKGIDVTVKEEVAPAPAAEVTPPAQEEKPAEVVPPAEATPAAEVTPAVETVPASEETADQKEIKSLHTKIDTIISALEKHGLLEGTAAVKETQTVATRSRTSGALKELNDFVETRELLRIVDNAVGKALENFNRSSRTTAK